MGPLKLDMKMDYALYCLYTVYIYIYIHIYYITTIHLGENVFLHGHAGLWKKCAECCSVLFAGAGERNVAWHCSNGLDDPNGLA
jgi:hypothetical protein